MRVTILLLLFLAALLEATSALRGGNDPRHLQAPPSKKDEPKKDDTKKDIPKDDASKKEDAKKKEEGKKKKDKKCKKAKKKKEDENRRRGRLLLGANTYTRSQKLQRRFLQAPLPMPEEELPYCLHADFTAEECANLNNLPKDGSVSSELQMEIVHYERSDSRDVLREVERVLDSEDTKSRFVGCQETTKAPPPQRQRERQRALQESEAEEGNDVEVTGVAFESIRFLGAGACKTTDIPAGSVCNVVQSNVEIFYQSTLEPSEDDQRDMKALLVETIESQVNAGSYQSVGRVDGVTIAAGSSWSDNGSDTTGNDSGSGTKDTTTTGDFGDQEEILTTEPKEGGGVAPYVGGVAALLVIFGIAYWYGMREGDDDIDDEKQDKDQTSDESD